MFTMVKATIPVAIGAFVFSCATGLVVDAAPPPSLDSVIARLESNTARIVSQPSWHFRYHHSRDYSHAPPGYLTTYEPREIVNAGKGKWLFFSESIEKGGSTQSSWKNNISIRRRPTEMIITPDPDDLLFSRTHYTDLLALNLFPVIQLLSPDIKKLRHGDTAAAFRVDLLPEAIKTNINDYQLRPDVVDIGGHRCIVVERPERDIIWLDTDKGFALVKRRFAVQENKWGWQVENSEFFELMPGLWMPRIGRVERYHSDKSPPAMRGTVRSIEISKLIEARFTELPDSFFDIKPIDEGLVVDEIRGMSYTRYPPGTNMIQTLARRGPDLIAENWRSRALRYALLAAIGLCVVGIVFQIIRRRST